MSGTGFLEGSYIRAFSAYSGVQFRIPTTKYYRRWLCSGLSVDTIGNSSDLCLTLHVSWSHSLPLIRLFVFSNVKSIYIYMYIYIYIYNLVEKCHAG